MPYSPELANRQAERLKATLEILLDAYDLGEILESLAKVAGDKGWCHDEATLSHIELYY